MNVEVDRNASPEDDADAVGQSAFGKSDTGQDRDCAEDEVPCDVESAVVSDQNVIAVLWINPDRMMIAVRDSRLERGKLLAAIG